MNTLNVVSAHVLKFAEDHENVGAQVSAAAAAEGISAELAPALGPAGAVFTAAVVSFEAALADAGSALDERYRDIGQAVRGAVEAITTTDEASATRFQSPAAPLG